MVFRVDILGEIPKMPLKFLIIKPLKIMETGIVFAVIGAAASAVLGGAGSSIGMGLTGAKAAGVIAEKPNLFGKVMIMTALPGSQAVYGLLIAFMIFAKMTGGDEITRVVGQQLMWSGMIMGVAGFFSGWFQGRVAAAGVGAIARNESLLVSAIVLAALVETSAIFGLLMGIFFLNAA